MNDIHLKLFEDATNQTGLVENIYHKRDNHHNNRKFKDK